MNHGILVCRSLTWCALLALLIARSAAAQDPSIDQLLRQRAAEIKASLIKSPQKDDPEVNRVVKALKDRAARIRTVHLEWTLTRNDKAGSFSGSSVASSKRAGALPPEDTTTEMRKELWFKGDQLRLEEHGRFFHADFDHPIDTHNVYAYVGDKVTHYNHSADISAVGAGIIAIMDDVPPLGSSEAAPIAIMLSPLDPRITPWMAEGPLERAPAKDDSESICIHVQPFGSYFWALKSDPERIVRLESLRRDDTLAIETTVEWEDVASIGAVPRRWVMTQFDRDGTITHVVTGDVTRHEFNAPIASESLTLTYSQGVQVYDFTRNAKFLADGAGGLLPFESGARRAGPIRSMTMLGVVAIVLGALGIVALRRKRRDARFLT